jgi:riboflavin synthase
MKETLNQSAAAQWAPGVPVNLERAARVGDRLGGHIVQGHVDATARVLDVRPGDQWQVMKASLSPEIAPLVAHKGSITIDGVSLTVSAVGKDWAEVSLIPETLSATTLGRAAVGDVVNIETDILARQVLRLKEFIVQETLA